MKKLTDKIKNFLPADKPRKAEKDYSPPGTGMKKAGVAALWFMVIFAFVISTLTLLSRGGDEEVVVAEVEINAATKPEAVEFAQTFTEEYFTWTPDIEGWNDREVRLEPLLADGIDAQAGLVTGSQDWSSRVNDVRTMRVEEVAENRAVITLQVSQVLEREVDEENERIDKTFMFAVPVGFNQAYGVTSLPYFTAVDTVTAVERERLTGTSVAVDEEQNVSNFLNTFFQSYSVDTPDKLAYFLSDPDNRQGLGGSVVFSKLNSSVVFEGGTAGSYNVSAIVEWEDAETGTLYLSEYQLVVEEDNGRYVVTQLKRGVN